MIKTLLVVLWFNKRKHDQQTEKMTVQRHYLSSIPNECCADLIGKGYSSYFFLRRALKCSKELEMPFFCPAFSIYLAKKGPGYVSQEQILDSGVSSTWCDKAREN